jgi:elongation factor P--(R)-beta-lysine ligase
MENKDKSSLLAWAKLLKRTRAYLDRDGFTEVMTNALVSEGAFESSIDTLKVSYSDGKGELHSSPEIEMKRCLATAQLPIYQICKCYRDDPRTPVHWKEFTMLEFYRMNASYLQILQDVQEWLEEIAERKLSFEILSVNDAIKKFAGLDLEAAPNTAALRKMVENTRTLQLSSEDTWEDIFFKVIVEKIEPALPPDRPVFLIDYPVSVSPLSQRKGDGIWAERFELYWCGMELCNGCTELSSPEELKKRYEEESALRRALKKPPHPFPSHLYEAMKTMPPAAGVAVGLERTFLALEQCLKSHS